MQNENQFLVMAEELIDAAETSYVANDMAKAYLLASLGYAFARQCEHIALIQRAKQFIDTNDMRGVDEALLIVREQYAPIFRLLPKIFTDENALRSGMRFSIDQLRIER